MPATNATHAHAELPASNASPALSWRSPGGLDTARGASGHIASTSGRPKSAPLMRARADAQPLSRECQASAQARHPAAQQGGCADSTPQDDSDSFKSARQLASSVFPDSMATSAQADFFDAQEDGFGSSGNSSFTSSCYLPPPPNLHKRTSGHSLAAQAGIALDCSKAEAARRLRGEAPDSAIPLPTARQAAAASGGRDKGTAGVRSAIVAALQRISSAATALPDRASSDTPHSKEQANAAEHDNVQSRELSPPGNAAPPGSNAALSSFLLPGPCTSGEVIGIYATAALAHSASCTEPGSSGATPNHHGAAASQNMQLDLSLEGHSGRVANDAEPWTVRLPERDQSGQERGRRHTIGPCSGHPGLAAQHDALAALIALGSWRQPCDAGSVRDTLQRRRSSAADGAAAVNAVVSPVQQRFVFGKQLRSCVSRRAGATDSSVSAYSSSDGGAARKQVQGSSKKRRAADTASAQRSTAVDCAEAAEGTCSGQTVKGSAQAVTRPAAQHPDESQDVACGIDACTGSCAKLPQIERAGEASADQQSIAATLHAGAAQPGNITGRPAPRQTVPRNDAPRDAPRATPRSSCMGRFTVWAWCSKVPSSLVVGE